MRTVRFSALIYVLTLGFSFAEAAPIAKNTPLKRFEVIDPHTSESKGAPGDFSFYLLTQEWVQEFCFHNPQLKNCSQPVVTDRRIFALHGLWPQYKNPDDYPYNCSNSPGCPDGSVCMLDWKILKPATQSFLESAIPVGAQQLANHEWQKHGTCSGLKQQEYFDLVQKLFGEVGTPGEISGNIDKSLSYEAIQSQYGYQVMLKCSEDAGRFYLDSVVSCWDKGGNQFACDVSGEEADWNSCQGVSEIWIRQSNDKRTPVRKNLL